jgi:hypothetical protein
MFSFRSSRGVSARTIGCALLAALQTSAYPALSDIGLAAALHPHPQLTGCAEFRCDY